MSVNPTPTTVAFGASVDTGSTPLTLGGLTFRVIDGPSEFPIGGVGQMRAVHDLPGGSRIVHTFGPKPKDVTFTGTFWGDTTRDNVKTLQGYAVDGIERIVEWGDERYYCIVGDIEPTYYHDFKAAYNVTLVITRDANGAFTIASATSIDSQVSALTQSATKLSTQISASDTNYAASGAPLAMTNTQLAVQNAGPLARLTGAKAQSLVNTVQTALSTVQSYSAGVSPMASWFPLATQLASALQLIIDNVQRGQSPKTTEVQGGSLFHVAAKYYGDPTLAFALASANGLATPQLSATVLRTLVLPPLAST